MPEHDDERAHPIPTPALDALEIRLDFNRWLETGMDPEAERRFCERVLAEYREMGEPVESVSFDEAGVLVVGYARTLDAIEGSPMFAAADDRKLERLPWWHWRALVGRARRAVRRG